MTSLADAGAFVETFDLEPTGSGPLNGLRFAIKDLIDVAGQPMGGGNPTWRETHPPAVVNAVCVDQLLLAGARGVGKTVTDELAFGLDGENYFYGTPLNPRAPERVPGGSSSGSASAVACGLAELALGTDTGGSIRIPAHNCGLFGLRPSHGRVSVAGVMPLAPSFDTVGLLAAEAAALDASVRVLLGLEAPRPAEIGTIHLLTEAFDLADEEVRSALRAPVERLRRRLGSRLRETSLREIDGAAAGSGLDPWFEAFHVPQWAEIWSALGSWIEQSQPALGPRTANNFNLARTLDRSRLRAATAQREGLARTLNAFLGPLVLLLLPSGPSLAPVKGSLPLDRRAGSYYPRTVAFVSLAGVSRAPQVSLPLAEHDGVPLGLSLLGRYGEDVFLLDAMREVLESL